MNTPATVHPLPQGGEGWLRMGRGEGWLRMGRGARKTAGEPPVDQRMQSLRQEDRPVRRCSYS
jgi:hypothetical protein